MDVILQRDMPKLGKTGEVVHVKDGYVRNYLLPRAFAVPATGGALKDHNARLARENERTEKMRSTAQADAGKMEGLKITLIGKVGTGTKLYGSITAQDVADAVAKEAQVTVDKRRVGLADPIKTLGTYTVPVRLHSDITVPVTVEVTTEEELARRKAQEAAAAATAQAAAEAAAQAETPAEADTGEAADGAEAQSAGETS